MLASKETQGIIRRVLEEGIESGNFPDHQINPHAVMKVARYVEDESWALDWDAMTPERAKQIKNLIQHMYNVIIFF